MAILKDLINQVKEAGADKGARVADTAQDVISNVTDKVEGVKETVSNVTEKVEGAKETVSSKLDKVGGAKDALAGKLKG